MLVSEKRGTIPIVSEIYQWKHYVDIPIWNEHLEQCQGEREQFP
jgi:hypothetical protein